MRLIRLLKKDLAKEVSEWADDGLISPQQARDICARYDIDYDTMSHQSLGYRLLIVLGYLFIGLSVITLLGANWDEIPRMLRMLGLLVVTATIHGVAIRAYAQGQKANATGLFLLGNLFYGASIILVAQIYHLGEHMPDGVFWWALGSLPIALLLHNSWLTLFSCLLGLLWFVLELSYGFFPALFPLFIAGGLFGLLKASTNTPLFLTVVVSMVLFVESLLSVAWAGGNNYLDIYPEHFLVSAALFVFAYAVSHSLHSASSNKAKDYGTVLSLWSLRFGLLMLFVLSYIEPWEGLIEQEWSHLRDACVVIGLFSASSIGLAWRTQSLASVLPVVGFYLVSMAFVLMSSNSADAIYFQVFYNVVLVGAGVGLVINGINNGVSHYFILGVATILLMAFIRYVDLIGDYVGGAILFMLLAAMLLGAARYWRRQQAKQQTKQARL